MSHYIKERVVVQSGDPTRSSASSSSRNSSTGVTGDARAVSPSGVSAAALLGSRRGALDYIAPPECQDRLCQQDFSSHGLTHMLSFHEGAALAAVDRSATAIAVAADEQLEARFLAAAPRGSSPRWHRP